MLGLPNLSALPPAVAYCKLFMTELFDFEGEKVFSFTIASITPSFLQPKRLNAYQPLTSSFIPSPKLLSKTKTS